MIVRSRCTLCCWLLPPAARNGAPNFKPACAAPIRLPDATSPSPSLLELTPGRAAQVCPVLTRQPLAKWRAASNPAAPRPIARRHLNIPSWLKRRSRAHSVLPGSCPQRSACEPAQPLPRRPYFPTPLDIARLLKLTSIAPHSGARSCPPAARHGDPIQTAAAPRPIARRHLDIANLCSRRQVALHLCARSCAASPRNGEALHIQARFGNSLDHTDLPILLCKTAGLVHATNEEPTQAFPRSAKVSKRNAAAPLNPHQISVDQTNPIFISSLALGGRMAVFGLPRARSPCALFQPPIRHQPSSPRQGRLRHSTARRVFMIVRLDHSWAATPNPRYRFRYHWLCCQSGSLRQYSRRARILAVAVRPSCHPPLPVPQKEVPAA